MHPSIIGYGVAACGGRRGFRWWASPVIQRQPMDVPSDGVPTSMMHDVHVFSSSTTNHVHGVLQVCLPVSEECRGSSSPTRSRSHWPCSGDLRPTTSEVVAIERRNDLINEQINVMRRTSTFQYSESDIWEMLVAMNLPDEQIMGSPGPKVDGLSILCHFRPIFSPPFIISSQADHLYTEVNKTKIKMKPTDWLTVAGLSGIQGLQEGLQNLNINVNSGIHELQEGFNTLTTNVNTEFQFTQMVFWGVKGQIQSSMQIVHIAGPSSQKEM
ncbi:hypothetical protein Fmac_018482 [Flemingia macrophylla]|uniref:Uncharacterized protein n=1 Tax=Flemingia macrophylla TaxID=520843 RepID=A0ABD1M580_9FABA